MSFDIVLFDPERAPGDPEALREWAVGDRSADEEPSERLREAASMLWEWAKYGQPDDELELDIERHGGVMTVMAPYSVAQQLSKAVVEIAVLAGCGVYEISMRDRSVWYPDPSLDVERRDGLTLTLDNYGDYPDVSPALVSACLDRIGHTREIPAAYIVIEHSGGDYAQALGGDEQFVAECRQWADEEHSDFRHFAACTDGTDTSLVRLEAGDLARDAPADEVLDRAQVRDIMLSFVDGELPERVQWRDITESMR